MAFSDYFKKKEQKIEAIVDNIYPLIEFTVEGTNWAELASNNAIHCRENNHIHSALIWQKDAKRLASLSIELKTNRERM